MGRPKKLRPLVKVGVERAADLTMPQLMDLEHGPGEYESQFGRQAFERNWGSVDNMGRIWEAVRASFMPNPDYPEGQRAGRGWQEGKPYASAGTRPWGWWNFDKREPMPDTPAAQFKRLKVLDVLEGWEEPAFEGWLRAEIVSRLEHGFSLRDIADESGLGMSTVETWLRDDLNQRNAGDVRHIRRLQEGYLISAESVAAGHRYSVLDTPGKGRQSAAEAKRTIAFLDGILSRMRSEV